MDSNNFQQILEAYLICNKAEVLQILNAPKQSISEFNYEIIEEK